MRLCHLQPSWSRARQPIRKRPGMRRRSADHQDGVVSRYRPDDIRQARPIQHYGKRLRLAGIRLEDQELLDLFEGAEVLVDRSSDCTLRVELPFGNKIEDCRLSA